MTAEDWQRLADAYRQHVPPEPVVDTDPEVARRREQARRAVDSLYTSSRRPSLEFVVLTEWWVNGVITTDEAIERIKGAAEQQYRPPVTPEERWTAGLIGFDQMRAEIGRGDYVKIEIQAAQAAGDQASLEALYAYVRGEISLAEMTAKKGNN